MATKPLCSVDGCGKRRRYRDYCNSHYARWRRHGDPLAGRTAEGTPSRFYHEVVLTYDGNNCLIWPFAKDSGGYGQLWLDGGVNYVSRLVCARVHGPAPTPLYEAAHSCGNGNEGCCTKRHLSWKTGAGNQADRINHGTMLIGESVPSSKLKEHDAFTIIERGRAGETHQSIANSLGVSRSLVSMIIRGERWSHLQPVPST